MLVCRFKLLANIRVALGFPDLDTRRTLVQVCPASCAAAGKAASPGLFCPFLILCLAWLGLAAVS